MTTDIDQVTTEGLDLARALVLRPRAAAVRERLLAGDHTAIVDARQLDAEADTIIDDVLQALRVHGWPADDQAAIDDHVWPILNLLSTGDIGGLADDLENPPTAITTDELPANAVGIDGFDGWVQLIEWVDGGSSLVMFPSGASMKIETAQLRSVIPGPGTPSSKLDEVPMSGADVENVAV